MLRQKDVRVSVARHEENSLCRAPRAFLSVPPLAARLLGLERRVIVRTARGWRFASDAVVVRRVDCVSGLVACGAAVHGGGSFSADACRLLSSLLPPPASVSAHALAARGGARSEARVSQLLTSVMLKAAPACWCRLVTDRERERARARRG